jgi:hypothetical protein
MLNGVPLIVRESAWTVVLPTILFLWRKKRATPDENRKTEVVPEEVKQSAPDNWLYVGRDEDGTSLYLDIESLSYDPGNPVRARMWVKYRPVSGSDAHMSVASFLAAQGMSHETFGYIRQNLEIDFTHNLVGDLELVFHTPDGQIIDSVRYRAPEWKKITCGSVHDLLQKTVDGTWRSDVIPADPQLAPKLREKLKEINEAFEAFETADE